jgi:hypothetical protein
VLAGTIAAVKGESLTLDYSEKLTQSHIGILIGILFADCKERYSQHFNLYTKQSIDFPNFENR